MSLPRGYRFRAPTIDDLEAIAEVLAADDVDDVGEVVLDADFLREGWTGVDFDLAADAWVALDADGAIVGYAQVTRDGPEVVESWGIVVPAHRARGLGSEMLDRIEARAAELSAGSPAIRFRHAINADDRAAAAMLRERNLRPVHHFWHMGIDLDGRADAGEEPDGVAIDGVDPATDLPSVHGVLDEAFSEDRNYHPEPLERWIADETGSPSFDPSLWLVARDGGEPVGALTANVFGDRGWVRELGVRRSHRGRGIAAAMLRRSFGTFADRGLGRAMLNVDADNPTGATELYERVGMRVVKRWDLWERSAPPAR